MMSCGVIWFLLMLMLMPVMASSNTCVSEPENGTRWEQLESIADHIHIEDGLPIRTPESDRYYLWSLYKSLSRSERLEVVNEMSESLKEVAYKDRRLDMLGLILFGPEKGRSFLRIRREQRPDPVDVLDYIQCAETVDDLYVKHCGPLCLRGLRHSRSLSNLCYLATKEAIEEAMVLTCGMNIIESVGPQQQEPYGYFAFRTVLPFMLTFASIDILDQHDDDNRVARFLRLAKCVLLGTAIFLSYVGSLSAMVAVACCLALKYVIGSIIAPILLKKTELPWEKFTDGWTKDQVVEWLSSPGFKEWLIKNYDIILVVPDTSQDSDDE